MQSFIERRPMDRGASPFHRAEAVVSPFAKTTGRAVVVVTRHEPRRLRFRCGRPLFIAFIASPWEVSSLGYRDGAARGGGCRLSRGADGIYAGSRALSTPNCAEKS